MKRVKLSAEGLRCLRGYIQLKHRAEIRGWLVESQRGRKVAEDCVRVQWDGRKTKETLHHSFVEVIP